MKLIEPSARAPGLPGFDHRRRVRTAEVILGPRSPGHEFGHLATRLGLVPPSVDQLRLYSKLIKDSSISPRHIHHVPHHLTRSLGERS